MLKDWYTFHSWVYWTLNPPGSVQCSTRACYRWNWNPYLYWASVVSAWLHYWRNCPLVMMSMFTVPSLQLSLCRSSQQTHVAIPDVIPCRSCKLLHSLSCPSNHFKWTKIPSAYFEWSPILWSSHCSSGTRWLCCWRISWCYVSYVWWWHPFIERHIRCFTVWEDSPCPHWWNDRWTRGWWSCYCHNIPFQRIVAHKTDISELQSVLSYIKRWAASHLAKWAILQTGGKSKSLGNKIGNRVLLIVWSTCHWNKAPAAVNKHLSLLSSLSTRNVHASEIETVTVCYCFHFLLMIHTIELVSRLRRSICR